MTAVEVLKKARALLVERGWTRSAFARNAYGEPVQWESDAATCYCTTGAIRRAARNEPLAQEAFSALRSVVGARLISWNDDLAAGQDEVLAAFDKAIASLETP